MAGHFPIETFLVERILRDEESSLAPKLPISLSMFRIVATYLTTLLLLIHAIGGCCWHHAHGGRWLFGTVSSGQDCHAVVESECVGCCRDAHSHDADDDADGICRTGQDVTEPQLSSGHEPSDGHSCLCCTEGRCLTVIERRGVAEQDLSVAFAASQNVLLTEGVNGATPVAAWRQSCLARLSAADRASRSQSALQVWLI
jgi:hypothetical protein